MYDLAREMLEGYFSSEEHEEFIKKNNAYEEVDESKDYLLNKYKECERDDISSNLMAVFNVGESYGVTQGIGIGIKFAIDCMGR